MGHPERVALRPDGAAVASARASTVPPVAPETIVWNGSEALRPYLVAVGDLQRHPQNPRIGDVGAIRLSLERFGQVRPLLADKGVIVAGNHTYLAALELGWTHVAVVAHDFQSEEEAKAFLLADNRLPDLGGYDDASLRDLLRSLEELEGTGYSADDLADLDRELAAAGQALDAAPPTKFPPIDPDTLVTEHECPSCGYQWSGNPGPRQAPEGE